MRVRQKRRGIIMRGGKWAERAKNLLKVVRRRAAIRSLNA